MCAVGTGTCTLTKGTDWTSKHDSLSPCAAWPLLLPTHWQIINTATGNVAKGCEILLFAHDNVYLQQVPRKVPHI